MGDAQASRRAKDALGVRSTKGKFDATGPGGCPPKR